MMYKTVLVLAFFSTCLSWPLNDPLWREYKFRFGKVYKEEDEAARYKTWRRNVKEIEMHNSDYSHTYKQGMNQFTDQSDEEIEVEMARCVSIPEQYWRRNTTLRAEAFVSPPSSVKLPETVNWVEHGYVTPVKSQGNCGSCYSFSATGSLEGQWFHKTGRLPSLSEQQIVDCSKRWGNQGCGGGWYESAWEYVRDIGGIETETSYPYEAKVANCRFNRQHVAATVRGFVDLKYGDEVALKAAVATVGPVSVAIAVQGSFKRYSHGVYYEKYCKHEFWQLNHAVLVVGYGRENGQDYWLVKNSWGTRFGEAGYIKMSRNRGNNCGIATKPSYPLL